MLNCQQFGWLARRRICAAFSFANRPAIVLQSAPRQPVLGKRNFTGESTLLSKNGLYKHRIIPGHMGGIYTDDNIVLLTIEEHAEAHKQLYEKHGKYEDWLAWKTLSGQIGKEALTEELENLRRAHISESLRGREVTQETRLKISEANKGKPKSPEHRVALSKARMGKAPWNKGKTFSAESKKKMSNAKLGKSWSTARRLAEEAKSL
jgi:hypothetical protein